ncbi:sigma factor [Actinocorallia longicatena]|uniref:ECF RNA polymerase sigma factor SigK n=1 Tax=Actinocorallia longicatena TaxID=111803 RepID=A0ABP6QAP0_9ACTN
MDEAAAGPVRPDPAELADLLGRVGRGDRTSFEALYDQVSGPVHGLLVELLGDRGAAERVGSDVLVEVWRSAGGFRPGTDDPLVWVFTVADRHARGHAGDPRERERRRAPAFRGEMAETRRTRAYFDRLTARQRLALFLALHGCSAEDSAPLLGVSVRRARLDVRDGLIRMRDWLFRD